MRIGLSLANSLFIAIVLIVGAMVVAVGAIGALIPSAFWGTWYCIFGFIPEFMGYSRLWVDMIFGAVFAIVVAICLVTWSENPYKELVYSILFAIFIASWFYSFAVGVAVIIFLFLLKAVLFAGPLPKLWEALKVVGIFILLILVMIFEKKDKS